MARVETLTSNSMTQTVYLTVIGGEKIHCAGCERRVANALRRLPGVQNVRASAQTQRVKVRIDPAQVGPEQVRAKLEQLGYQVTPEGVTVT